MKESMLLAGERDGNQLGNFNEKSHYHLRYLGHVYVVRNKYYSLCSQSLGLEKRQYDDDARAAESLNGKIGDIETR